MATALETLTATKSLGNVRALTSQARKDSAAGADATKGTQEQIDKLLGMVKAAVAELNTSISSIVPPIPNDSTVTLDGVPVSY